MTAELTDTLPERRAYIVSADHTVANPIAAVAAHVGFDAAIFSSAHVFAKRQDGLEWGVVVIDLNLPDDGGLHLLQTLPAIHSPHLLIATSDSPSVRLAVEAMRIGAFHYLARPLMTGELEATLHEGHLALTKRRRDALQRSLASDTIKALSPRQREVLRGLASGETNAAMATRLGLSARTVEGYRRAMMSRLGASHISEAVRLAVTAGLAPLP